ncbi:ladderlectin-like isoform X2 [Channa argus]|uniref:ladderlectin-like isoform X2 n=1 Tax=Channa argus TaxID=215402 RepID=UPI00352141E1
MKILAMCVLGCAVVVLVGAAAVEEEKAQNDQTERNNLDKRYTLYHRGWSRINGRDFFYVRSPMTWYQAEKYCQSIGANLASVHNALEHRWLQKLIFVATHYYKEAWIGGSDAQQVSGSGVMAVVSAIHTGVEENLITLMAGSTVCK